MKTYNITISGYGAEIVCGRIKPETYKYFKKNRISLDDFITEDEETTVPKALWPFTPSCWHDCDDLVHANGPFMSVGTFITVKDSDENTIWESELDITQLHSNGVKVSETHKWSADDEYSGTIVYAGVATEKGLFFESTIETNKFDPKNLSISYESINDDKLFCRLEYQDEEIYSDEYSTTGKSSSHEFIEIKNKNFAPVAHKFSNKKLTSWFDISKKPSRIGNYEIMYSNGLLGSYLAFWDGQKFYGNKPDLINREIHEPIKCWRGLNSQVKHKSNPQKITSTGQDLNYMHRDIALKSIRNNDDLYNELLSFMQDFKSNSNAALMNPVFFDDYGDKLEIFSLGNENLFENPAKGYVRLVHYYIYNSSTYTIEIDTTQPDAHLNFKNCFGNHVLFSGICNEREVYADLQDASHWLGNWTGYITNNSYKGVLIGEVENLPNFFEDGSNSASDYKKLRTATDKMYEDLFK